MGTGGENQLHRWELLGGGASARAANGDPCGGDAGESLWDLNSELSLMGLRGHMRYGGTPNWRLG